IRTVPTRQLKRLHSEKLASGLALPGRRDRPVIRTNYVARWHVRPALERTLLFHRTLGVEEHTRRQRPRQSFRWTVVEHEVQRDVVIPRILPSPAWVEHQRIIAYLIHHAEARPRHQCS